MAPGEDRRSHIACRETLNIYGRQRLRQAVPILRRGVQNAQYGCRLPEGHNAFRVHGHVWHRAVLTQILRPEQIPGDPTKPVGVSNWNKPALGIVPFRGPLASLRVGLTAKLRALGQFNGRLGR